VNSLLDKPCVVLLETEPQRGSAGDGRMGPEQSILRASTDQHHCSRASWLVYRDFLANPIPGSLGTSPDLDAVRPQVWVLTLDPPVHCRHTPTDLGSLVVEVQARIGCRPASRLTAA